MHRQLFFLLAISILAGTASADMDGNIMVPPVTGETIDIPLEEGDTLEYSFDVISPGSACVDFSYIPPLGPSVNRPCAQDGSDTLEIEDSGIHKLRFGTKGGMSVGVHVSYTVNPAQGPEGPQDGEGQAGPQGEEGCPSLAILLMVAGSSVLIKR